MLGTVKWTATFVVHGVATAELYDEKGKVVASKSVPCEPPIACPFPMEDVEFGTYTAGLAVGQDRYYYDENEPVITVPNNISHATAMTISQTNPEIELEIIVET